MKQINSKVTYIGVDDLKVDIFENQYNVPDGISYNSYLIKDEKVAIMDTTDDTTAQEWKNNLKEALEGRTPDYLIVHHMEPDHASLIGWALEEYPSMTMVASAKAIQMAGQFFETNLEGRTLAVKEGDTLQLGEHSLTFVGAPMIHWPEVIVSFDTADGALYSSDAFGKFGALCKCGFYGNEDKDWVSEARRYFLNIVGKYGVQVQGLLKKTAALDIKSIRPLHGPILNEEFGKYIALYDTWSKYEPEEEGVFIACASIHGGTLEASEYLAEILKKKGAKSVVLSDICRSDFAEDVAQAFRFSKMVVAASSYDAGLFTPMYNFLHRLQIKNFSNRKVAMVENGSWAPSAGKEMKAMLEAMKNISIIEPMVTIKSRMKEADKASLEALAEEILR